MFVRSRIDTPLTFRKSGKSWTLKPHSITMIDDPTVTAAEIKGFYGSRVDVISSDEPCESRQITKNVLKSKIEKPVKKVEFSRETLDNILEQVNQELKEGTNGSTEMDNPENTEIVSGELNTGNTDDVAVKSKDSKATKAPAKRNGRAKKTTEKTKKAKPTRTSKAIRPKVKGKSSKKDNK